MERDEKVQWLAQQEAALQTLYAKLYAEVAKLQIEEAYIQRKIHSLVEKMMQTQDQSTVAALVQELEEANDPDFRMQELAKTEEVQEKTEQKLEEHFGSSSAELFAFKM